MLAQEIVPGLLRWTARHPGWNADAHAGGADDWGPVVACALYEAPDAVVLFDPLLPDGDERAGFLEWLDDRVGARAVTILTTIRWHRRDREQLAERYRSSRLRAWNTVPAGVEPRPLRGAGETQYWLPAVAALVVGDRLIGHAGGLSVCPQSWLADVRVDRAGVAALMRPLLDLAIERVLVSHGEPVLHDGRAALGHALADVDRS